MKNHNKKNCEIIKDYPSLYKNNTYYNGYYFIKDVYEQIKRSIVTYQKSNNV